MKTIVQKDAPVLRKMALAVPIEDIRSRKIQNILREMRVALDSQEDGVAIAAPQIGYPLRIFIVSHKVADLVKKEKNQTDTDKNLSKNKIENVLKHTIFINPIIKKISQKKEIVEEGCLSVRYLYGKVKRANKAIVEAHDENGIKFVSGGSGLLAQIFQHETDHLNGVLFIDKAKYVEEIIPDHIVRQNKQKINGK